MLAQQRSGSNNRSGRLLLGLETVRHRRTVVCDLGSLAYTTAPVMSPVGSPHAHAPR
jgi:hypothetical protein